MAVAASTRGLASRTDAAADLPWAVVGQGVHGLAALKALRQLGVAARGFERTAQVAGVWQRDAASARGSASLHMVSSKPFNQFPDFPAPASYPDYPSRSQAQEYIERYASHFGLIDHIAFGADVLAVEPVGDEVDLTIRDVLTERTATQRFAGVVLADGALRQPAMPTYHGLGGFRGEVMHSAQYRSSDVLRGRRVLVVGAGNSGCDIAVDSGTAAEVTYHSARRGYRYLPRYAFGLPVDQVADLLLALRVPLRLRRLVLGAALAVIVGDLGKYGVAEPDHALWETHPVVNQLLPHLIRHGLVTPKPDIERFEADGVVFRDGSVAEVDLVVFATGYRAAPGGGLFAAGAGSPAPGRYIFAPEHPAIAFSGLIQSDTGQWPLAHWQGMLIAHYARARRDRPQDARAFAAEVQSQADRRYSGGVRYARTPRHEYEVSHHEYLAVLQSDIRTLEGSL